MFKIIFIVFLAALLVTDLVFLPKPSRRAWQVLLVGFLLTAFAAMFPEPLIRLAEIMDLGRPVDLVIYVSTVVLVRELFLTRSRVSRLEGMITRLARGLAVENAVEVAQRDPTTR